jgi:putative alpha-1,2-mannosidase
MHLANGKTFGIVARGASRDNKYIQSATLNGKPIDKPFISHDILMAGGKLVLEMGSEPNQDWGRKGE